jgi:hypothetical protein
MVVGNFGDVFQVGDRLLLAVYSGTVMQIPDFAISPPSAFTLASTGGPVNGPNFSVSRNDAFSSTVTRPPVTSATPNGTSCPTRRSARRRPVT